MTLLLNISVADNCGTRTKYYAPKS